VANAAGKGAGSFIRLLLSAQKKASEKILKPLFSSRDGGMMILPLKELIII
jgi:hypothetical protein